MSILIHFLEDGKTSPVQDLTTANTYLYARKFGNPRVSVIEEQAAEILWSSCGYCPDVKSRLSSTQVAVAELQAAIETPRKNVYTSSLKLVTAGNFTSQLRLLHRFILSYCQNFS